MFLRYVHNFRAVAILVIVAGHAAFTLGREAEPRTMDLLPGIAFVLWANRHTDVSPLLRVATILVTGLGTPDYPMWYVPMITLCYLAAPVFIRIVRHPRLYWVAVPLLRVGRPDAADEARAGVGGAVRRRTAGRGGAERRGHRDPGQCRTAGLGHRVDHQSVGIGKIMGVRLPVVAGATFTVLNPMIIIADQYGGRDGLPYVYGALLVSGVLGLIIAKPFSMVRRVFPPLVTGTVIMMIGLSLIGADIGLIAGDETGDFVPKSPDSGQVSHIVLAAVVILMIVLISRFFEGFIGQTAVLISIILGTLIAWPMGLPDFSSVASARCRCRSA